MKKSETFDTKPTFIRKFPGILIYQEGRNDGVKVMIINSVFKGKPVDKIAFCKFYETEQGIFWKCRPFKKGSHTYKNYDIVSVDRNKAREVADAIYKLIGDEPEEVERGLAKSEEDKEILDIAKDFDM